MPGVDMTQHLSGFEYFWILSKHAGMPLAAAQKRFSEMERPDSSRRGAAGEPPAADRVERGRNAMRQTVNGAFQKPVVA